MTARNIALWNSMMCCCRMRFSRAYSMARRLCLFSAAPVICA